MAQLSGDRTEAPPGPLRRQVKRTAEVIWRMVLACAPFDAAGQGELLQFLDKHAETYLVSFDVAAVRERVTWGESMVSKWVFLFRPHVAEGPAAK